MLPPGLTSPNPGCESSEGPVPAGMLTPGSSSPGRHKHSAVSDPGSARCTFSRWLSPLPGCSSGETCFTKSAPTRAKPPLRSAQRGLGTDSGIPCSIQPLASPGKGKRGSPCAVPAMGGAAFPALPVPGAPALARLGGTILALFPLSDPGRD